MIKAKPFSLEQVRLLDGVFKQAMERDQAYLHSLDPARLLYNFRVTAGLPTDARPLGGWESPDCEVRGHFVGHYLSACALMAAATGDARFKQRVDLIVGELAACQEALPAMGYTPGYLAAFPESFFDRVERRDPVWAPYYTMHKIMAGLLDAYLHCGSAQALAVLERLAGWVRVRVDNLSYEQMQINLLMEFGGMNEVLANLYDATGNPEYLRLSMAFNDDVVLDPLKRGEDQLDRLHANTQIPKLIGLARQYDLSGDTALRDAARFFWERVALHRSYAIGGHSDDELFFPIHRFADHLSPVSAETCNTYNMLKLTHLVFGWEASARVMDFYERALFNHILGSQDPESGMMLYFASMKPGHFKVYSSPEHSFWCCTGTGVENHARYGEAIYSYSDDTLFVNLFIASELTWNDRGLVVRQETAFPEQDSIRLTLHCRQPTRLKLHLRYPGWASGFSLTLNGQDQAIDAQPGSYLTFDREWRDGDEILLRLPMSLHCEELPNAPEYVALLDGPIVLAGALGDDDLPEVFLKEMHIRDAAINDFPGPSVAALPGTAAEVVARAMPVEGQALTFSLDGLTLIPFYRMHHQRYTVYWKIQPAG